MLAETDFYANWMHWHQMSDTLDHIDPQALAEAHAFTWQILKEIDQGAYNKL